jgi:endoglucanase
MLSLVVRSEVVHDGSGAPWLLPGPVGFQSANGAVRVNPSYTPPFLLRRFAASDPRGPWKVLERTTAKLWQETGRLGAPPDWAAVSAAGDVALDDVAGPVASWDAIRTHLWAGMLCPKDPFRRAVRGAVGGVTAGFPVERLDVRTGRALEDRTPVAFTAALLPWWRCEAPVRFHAERRTVAAATRDGVLGRPPRYYDQSIALFALGFVDGRYHFADDGRLVRGGVSCGCR